MFVFDLHESSFSLYLAESRNGDVLVRIKSFLGDTGAVRVTPEEAAQLASHVTAMCEVLAAARERVCVPLAHRSAYLSDPEGVIGPGEPRR